MGKKLIRESVNVKVNWTEKEKMQVILQGSISVIGKLHKRFGDAIEQYERDGYEITSKDQNDLSFVAEKEYEIEDDDE